MLTIRPAREADLARAEELIARTNQLNATGRAFSLAELRSFVGSATSTVCSWPALEDRYGDYGTIGVALIDRGAEVWILRLLLVSSRVLSRGIGRVLLHEVMRLAQLAGVRLQADFVDNGRNRVLYLTYRLGRVSGSRADGCDRGARGGSGPVRGSPGVSEGAVRKLSRSNWRALIGLCGALARDLQDRRRGPSIRQLPGLQSRVRVDFDRWANPTITADSRNDALQALGYLTAHERLFQLDLFRRVAAGRMAEIVGPSALEADRQQRVFGFAEVAAAIVARLPPHERSALEAYVAGVNASIAVQRRRRPLECLLLGYRPEPWTCGDSMLVALLEFQEPDLGGRARRARP